MWVVAIYALDVRILAIPRLGRVMKVKVFRGVVGRGLSNFRGDVGLGNRPIMALKTLFLFFLLDL